MQAKLTKTEPKIAKDWLDKQISGSLIVVYV
jgi:hypothetical protein